MTRHDPRLRVLAALLAQGRTVHLTTGVLTLGAWGLGGGDPLLSIGVALVLAVETWFAARVGLDATLFEALATGVDPGSLDRGLVGLGLTAEGPSRPLSTRISGAIRLWRWQLVVATTQGGMLLLALFTRGWP